jgi:hypothetical protein
MRTIENGKYRIEIEPLDSPENPREYSDHESKMLCFHNNYSIGDKNNDYNPNDYSSWGEFYNEIIRRENPALILPIYAYEHGGITISTKRTGQYADRWDSGQLGFIFMSCEVARERLGVKRISSKMRERITNWLLNEVEEVEQYLQGDVYSFTITNVENDEVIDTCNGFYGSNFWTNGMWDNIDKEIVESLIDELTEEFGEKPI